MVNNRHMKLSLDAEEALERILQAHKCLPLYAMVNKLSDDMVQVRIPNDEDRAYYTYEWTGSSWIQCDSEDYDD